MRLFALRSLPALVAAALVAVALVQFASAAGKRDAAARATTIQVQGGEFFFKLSKQSIAKPGTVTFVFKNVGHVAHDFKINGKKTPLTQAGKTAKLTVTFKKAGKYPFICTVDAHAQLGMKGVFSG
jgi:uncharacterized cupredoxin-like copper-binding protein